MKSGELVIYVDESGSPDVISTTGEDLLSLGRTPRHLVIAALRCPDPNLVAREMRALIAWADALAGRRRPRGPLTHLHAAHDDDAVRVRVYEALARLPIKATAIVMDKSQLDPALPWYSDRTVFYNEMAGRLLCDSLHLYDRTRIIFSKKNFDTRADLVTMIETVGEQWSDYVARVELPIPALVTARHEAARMNVGLQAVDYIAWALFRAFEADDLRYYNLVKPIVRHVYDLPTLTHYTARRPMLNPPRLVRPSRE